MTGDHQSKFVNLSLLFQYRLLCVAVAVCTTVVAVLCVVSLSGLAGEAAAIDRGVEPIDMDEPTWDKTKTECFGDPIDSNPGMEYMPAAYDMIKQHDPNHPVTTVTCHFEDPQLFGPYLDIIQADYYCVPPIPAGNFAGTGFRGIKMFVDSLPALSRLNRTSGG